MPEQLRFKSTRRTCALQGWLPWFGVWASWDSTFVCSWSFWGGISTKMRTRQRIRKRIRKSIKREQRASATNVFDSSFEQVFYGRDLKIAGLQLFEAVRAILLYNLITVICKLSWVQLWVRMDFGWLSNSKLTLVLFFAMFFIVSTFNVGSMFWIIFETLTIFSSFSKNRG